MGEENCGNCRHAVAEREGTICDLTVVINRDAKHPESKAHVTTTVGGALVVDPDFVCIQWAAIGEEVPGD